jgi:carboxymethylenebutenolidase
MTDASMITFAVNGREADGYLATPDGGSGPGLLVVQEWWGLVPQIKATCDRLAAEGFTALAPDLYHGDHAEHTEMDKAGELMNSLPPDRAAADMSGAIDHLLASDAVAGDRVGVIGFCMGGLLALMISALEGDRVAATVPFYGAPLGEGEPDWSGLTAKVDGHFAEHDDFFPPDAVKDLEARLQDLGKDVRFTVHPGTGHAFANEHNPLGTRDDEAAAAAWSEAVDFLKANL